MFLYLIRYLTKYRSDGEGNGTILRELGEFIRPLKELMETTFDKHCETGFYTLKFHFLDYLVENLESFGNLETLGASPYERFNVHIKRAYRITSQRWVSGMLELVEVIDATRGEG